MTGTNDRGIYSLLVSALGFGRNQGRVSIVGPVRRKHRVRRDPGGERIRFGSGACCADWRNPLGVGNRRWRLYAERHGVEAMREARAKEKAK